jgi:anti-sigma B factor antagonist
VSVVDISIEVSTPEEGRVVVTVSGAIDLQTRGELLDAGHSALEGGAKQLVLDLAAVSFIDSTGIGALVELGHDADDGSANLVLRNPSARVERILEVTGLSDAWPTEYETG